MAEASARILVVDDDADIRNLLRARLEARHYRVHVAENGEAALAAIALDHPDLVITDWMMPGVDGRGLLQAVRDDPATVSIPVILLTARGTLDDHSDVVEAGADDYLAKPIEFRELFARINALLNPSHPRRGPVSPVRELDDATGFIVGVPLATVLQMVQMDNRTCRLDIVSPDGVGRLDCHGGQLIDASTGDLRGEEAAYRILGWRASRIAIRSMDGPIGEPTIRVALAHLLIEAVRQEDERGRAAPPRQAASMSTRPTVSHHGQSHPDQAEKTTESIPGHSRSVRPAQAEAERTEEPRPIREIIDVTPAHRLVFSSGPRRGETFALTKAVTSVGRSPDNDIVVDSAEVSRHHARLEYTHQGLTVIDVGSTNGTWVKGESVRSNHVRVGDEIVFGTTKATILGIDDPA
ncbi:MAG: Adenylate cyclase [uncultured Thermomicrobiales bacterium]|uniref:Adenylate cyclase n=1 Tax=uncultured Thermomicrobiales bacterium TaxID=1645740 RepID=A0A6J4UCQ5_9BACT|nr:MAG: Adenylate cyclase [uncultured Thermomicrobiales bacterium]